MRAVFFFISLFFLLLGSGQQVYAKGIHKHMHQISNHDVTKNHHIKITNKNLDSTIIEDADLDLEEESCSVSNSKDVNNNNFFIEKYISPNNQFFIIAYLNNYFIHFKNYSALNSLSSPIYIVNRVLRI
ncbi:MAG: hypothetical protein PSV16_03155 [Flavobacterium sp.]|nr:hypothetical protein [Flavobacterium sp.]